MAHHRVRPGTRVRLDHIDPADTGKHTDEAAAHAKLGRDIARLAKLQDVLYAARPPPAPAAHTRPTPPPTAHNATTPHPHHPHPPQRPAPATHHTHDPRHN